MKIKVNFEIETKEFVPIFVIRNKIKEIENTEIKVKDIKINNYLK